MVHRPSDSRLLTNLLSHEKDYSKHLATLLDAAHASLSSFSAYASASSPPISTVVLAVAGSFAGADDALAKYMSAVEEWRNRLVELKELEDEVGNVMRDREIYVNRLIKASKSQKPTRESLLVSQLPTSGSTVSLKSEFSLTGKLSAAQADLQACEAHLAVKERELDALRLTTIHEGLSLRCKALVECGWAWGEMGKEGLRALEGLNEPTSSSSGSFAQNDRHPLPPPPKPPSDLQQYSELSLAPSQSASQTAVPEAEMTPKLSIPPAHAIKDLPFPAHILSRRITEEELRGSSEEEGADETHVQIIENPRFAAQRQRRKSGSDQDLTRNRRFSIRQHDTGSTIGAGGDVTVKSDVGPITSRDRRITTAGPPTSTTHANGGGSGFFGSIRGMFGGGKKNGDEPDSPKKSKWKSRTDKNLKTLKHESEDEDEGAAYGNGPTQFANPTTAAMFAVPPSLTSPPPHSVKKLRRASAGGKKKEVVPAPPVTLTSAFVPEVPESGVVRAEAWVNGQSKLHTDHKGGANGEEGEEGERSSRTPARKSSMKRRSSKSRSRERPVTLVKQSPVHGKLISSVSSPVQLQGDATGTTTMLTRQSSVKSSQSVPHVNRGAVNPRRASSVIEQSPRTRTFSGTVSHGSGVGHQRSATMSWAGGEHSESLMAIVEGVAKQNREERDRSVGGTILPRAPQAKSRKELEMEMNTTSTSNPPSHPQPSMSTTKLVKAPKNKTPKTITKEQSPAKKPNEDQGSSSVPTAPKPIFAQMTVPKAPSPVHVELSMPEAGPSNGPGTMQASIQVHQPVPMKPLAAVASSSSSSLSQSHNPSYATSGKLPLRSALKNSTSRTPSPAVHVHSPLGANAPTTSSAFVAPPVTGPAVKAPPPVMSTLAAANASGPGSSPINGVNQEQERRGEEENEDEDDDGASMSSYETGHERFEDEELSKAVDARLEASMRRRKNAPLEPQLPPVPPMKTPQAVPNGSTTPGLSQRKSVRVSLQPTFSPTPAVMDDSSDEERTYGDDQKRHGAGPSWTSKLVNGNGNAGDGGSGGGKVKSGASERLDRQQDMWLDSSEEDEEYSRAKKMLNMLTPGYHSGKRSNKSKR